MYMGAGGGGGERSPIKIIMGGGGQDEKIGGLHEKKSLGGGCLKLWAFHPPCVFKWNSPDC